jgi:hypothetical protein
MEVDLIGSIPKQIPLFTIGASILQPASKTNVWSVYEDKDHELWLNIWERKLYKLNRQADRFEVFDDRLKIFYPSAKTGQEIYG